ncbi:MAG: arsenite methyltransferase [Alphaproteobacteria bacterium]
MNDHDDIRKEVSSFYGKSVSRPAGGGCCSGPAQKGAVANLAGYSREELDALPADAVVNSFGCGNPLAFSDLETGDVVLDLGSGAGIDLLVAAPKVGPTGRVIGVDMTDEMIAKAKANIAASGFDNVEVRKGLIEDLPVRSSSVDWVVSNCVINLSPHKPKVFAEIARVLKPGGRVLISDIVVDDLPQRVRQNKALYTACVAGAISEAAYLDGLRKAGLEDVAVRERLVYEASQLKAIVGTELPGGEPASAPDPGLSDDESIGELIGSIVGKVWSAKFYARKPGR